jgi:hypothetical protein
VIDFMTISTRTTKSGGVEIYPKFIIKRSTDLMIRGGDFYAIWLEERGMWSTDEQDALDLIDKELDKYVKEYQEKYGGSPRALFMRDADSGMVDKWHKYCQIQLRDNYHMLDEQLIFSNTPPRKKDYASKRLPYPLEDSDCPAFKKLISTLYTEEERRKIEWAIGSIVTGDSKTIQKFMVLYGAAGTGKSTILNIIQQLFEGYYSVFDAKALGSSSNSFALEAFKSNPLVAIQHDGDLSKIEDNTRLNSLVSHEEMTINEKFKSTYSNRFKCFLFMGTNKPVKITDAKSGLLRRLIDVTPSGNKLSTKEYKTVTQQISFELGAIANYCKDVYLSDPGRYDDYVPTMMMSASNDFYNFMIDSYHIFVKDDGTTLKAAWEMYRTYCEDAKVPYPFSQRLFKEELKNYFHDFDTEVDGNVIRNIYSGFRTEVFETSKPKRKEIHKPKLIEFNSTESIFDQECENCPAQYASAKETPTKKWENVTTVLSDIDTSKVHYVKVPENHIVIDFDIPDENGNKCFEKNVEEASKWPATYAELSKSEQGIHLHYIYTGDPSKLSRVYADHVEIKVFTGNSSLRRKLTKCNNLPIASISSGLPLKGEDKVINFEGLKNEKALRTTIKRNLNKEIHDSTKCSIDFIYKILEDAYNGGMKYDVSDMRNSVYILAANSTNQSDYCLKLVNKMHFKSEEPSSNTDASEAPIVFYDVEVFPNLFLVNWKVQGKDKPIVRMVNPSPSDIEGLLKYRLIGFNNRRYDNHIIYGCLIGYTNEQLFELSKRIVNSNKGERNNGLFGEAYNLSYTDIYDFASAANKKSLKKWEIELGIHHQELGLPWDQPVPEELWTKVAEYCDNDVIATEALFDHLQADWTARQILADLAGMTVNDTTNTLTTKIIFGSNRKPQNEFCYRNMAEPVQALNSEVYNFLLEACPDMIKSKFGTKGSYSALPFFPGYKYEAGKSTYRDEEVGEGGYVYAEPGIHTNVALLDIASMHPHSAIAECLFGPRYTRAFRDIVEGRVSIKHEAWDVVNEMLDGKLKPYVQKVINGETTSDDLANALKTAINSVYGLTSASFDNPFRDPRNKDNIVAKRGALFMINLKHEVQERGFTVAHIKTDSIKIPNATPEIIQFAMDYAKSYGYTFEHEATYEKMCLVNDAVYIAKYASTEWAENAYGYLPTKQKKKAGKWDATGKQFAVPYVFKTLFTKDSIEFEDMCETMSVATSLYLDANENLPEGEHDYRFIGKVGSFCPILPGHGGAELLREGKDKEGNVKYSAATGSKGYRWLEAEMVKTLGKEKDIDRSYYNKLVDDAVNAISQYGDFEQFISDDPVPDVAPWFNSENPDELPWRMACGKDTCYGCPNLIRDGCKEGHDNSDFWAQIDDGDLFMKR